MPGKVKEIQAFAVGAGGTGSNGNWGNTFTGGGGGGGGYTKTGYIDTTTDKAISVTIGAGSSFSNGGSTSIKSSVSNVSASGGEWMPTSYTGSRGGSGGGWGDYFGSSGDNKYGNSGYSDGSGSFSAFNTYGRGQGTTTRAFGESDGTLYSGGGGGGRWYLNGNGSKAGYAGGSGGGGNGSGSGVGFIGDVNTGGGGGGGGTNGINIGFLGGDGGSGIAIIRWGY